MALPQTPEQMQAMLDAASNQMTGNSVIGQMLAGRGFSQLPNQLGAPYGGYRQAPSTLPGYSPYAPHPSPRTISYVSPAAFAAQYAKYVAAGLADPPEPIEDAGIRPGEVRAYRCWRWQQGFLQSMAMDDIWAPGEPMEGQIGYGDGVHAWKSMSKALTYAMPYLERPDYVAVLVLDDGGGTIVIGQVELWGDIVEHEHGYRSEFAAIVSLDSILGAGKNDKQALETLRERYGL